MIKRGLGVLLAAAGAAGSGGCGVVDALSYGCSDRDRRLATTLAELPVLALAPEKAESVDSGSGCDDDDGFAHAGRSYRSPLTRFEVLDFYRAAADRDGWAVFSHDASPGNADGLVVSTAADCYTKQVDGTTAYLAVWFPSDLNNLDGQVSEPPAPADEFGLDVTASHDGTAWC